MEIRANTELKWIQDHGRCHRAFDMEALVRDVCGVDMTIEGLPSEGLTTDCINMLGRMIDYNWFLQ